MPAPSVHTAFMRFAIDVVFTDRDLKVVKVKSDVHPWRAVSSRGARHALELAAGEARRRGIAVGDCLAIGADQVVAGASTGVAVEVRPPQPPSESIDPTPEPPVAHGNYNGSILSSVSRSPDELANAGSKGRRVLIIGNDRRFRSVAATLLERRGMRIAVVDQPLSLDEVDFSQVDVAVIDAGASLTEAAQRVGGIMATAPAVGVVVVADRPANRLNSIAVVSKWGSFDDLTAAIEASTLATPELSANLSDVP